MTNGADARWPDRRAHVRGFANAFQGQRSRRVGEHRRLPFGIHVIEALRVAEAGRHTVHSQSRPEIQSQGTSQALEGAVRRGQRRAVLARPSIQYSRNKCYGSSFREARSDVLGAVPRRPELRVHHSSRVRDVKLGDGSMRRPARRRDDQGIVRCWDASPAANAATDASSAASTAAVSTAAPSAPVACRISSRARWSLSASVTPTMRGRRPSQTALLQPCPCQMNHRPR